MTARAVLCVTGGGLAARNRWPHRRVTSIPHRIKESIALSHVPVATPGAASLRRFLIVEQCHEPEIHMKLLVTVKQRQAGIVGNEVDVGFLIAAKHDDVL
jgi:hypothetical protein